MERPADSHAERQADRLAYKQTDTQTDRQTYRDRVAEISHTERADKEARRETWLYYAFAFPMWPKVALR